MALLPLAAIATLALAAQGPDLTSLSLEEFLNVEVTSVRRSRQKLSRTAAAVFVITQEDIRRTGAHSVPEALRLAPGVHVARISATTWAIGIRGFTSVYSNKLLVMVDGRTLYHPLLSGVVWSDAMLTLNEVDRIEVIRGPGATMWGSNAVSGVINIITKTAEESQGGFVSASTGSPDMARAQLRYGGKLGSRGHWRVAGSGDTVSQMDIPGQQRMRPWSSARAGTRLDWARDDANQFSVASEVSYSNSQLKQITAGPTGMGLLNAFGGLRNGFASGRWTHTDRKGNTGTLLIGYDGRRTDAGTFGVNLNTYDLDYQRSMALPGRHQLQAGGSFRINQLQTVRGMQLSFQPRGRTYRIYSAMLQDEWQVLPDKLYLTVGGKLEHNWGTGFNAQPEVRLLWAPDARFVAWGGVARAVRTPSHADFAMRYSLQLPGMPFLVETAGDENIDSERLSALDAGIRWQASRRVAFDLAVFRHNYRSLMVFQASTSLAFRPGTGLVLPAVNSNGNNGRNQGGEAVVHVDVTNRWQVTGTYSGLWTRTWARPGFNAARLFSLETYDPRHQGYLRSSWDLPRHWSADLTFYRRGELGNGWLPAANRIDFRLHRSFGESSDLSFGVQNLGRAGQFEVPVDLLVPRATIRHGLDITFTRRF